MMGLETEEEFLQDALPKGTGIADARAALRSKGIQFVEEPQARDAVILERKNRHIAAAAGDEVISARAETDAYQFPCGYEIEIVLVFGVDQKLKDKYIDRLQLCP
jgi:hypothetical protein